MSGWKYKENSTNSTHISFSSSTSVIVLILRNHYFQIQSSIWTLSVLPLATPPPRHLWTLKGVFYRYIGRFVYPLYLYIHCPNIHKHRHLQTFSVAKYLYTHWQSKVFVHTLALPRPISSLLRLRHHFPKKAILFSII